MARRKRSTNDSLTATPDLFASSRYQPALGPAVSLSLQGSRRDIRRSLRAECPPAPGVYGIADAQGQLIYVGMSRRLQRRLLTYFSSQARRKKEARLGRRAVTLIWQPAAHELIARLRERELIRRLRPEANIQGLPTRMNLGYLVMSDHEAAGFQLLPRIPKTHSGAWGPVPITGFVRSAVEALNHQFGLRDCPRDTPMLFQGESRPGVEPMPCLRADLGTCLSPCVGGCTRRTYERAVSAARAFLEGESESVLRELERQMAAAVADRNYERAARCRDRLASLSRLNLHLRRFHDWRCRAHFVYPLESEFDGTPLWLIIVRGDVQTIVRRPSSKPEKAAVLALLEASDRQRQGRQGEALITGPDEFAAGRILFRWFRLHDTEKDHRLSFSRVRRICRIRVSGTGDKNGKGKAHHGDPSSAGD